MSTCKKILSTLPLVLFDIILPTLDIGTDAVLISKLYAINFACIDENYDNCKEADNNCDGKDNPACHFVNGNYSCRHTDAYKICLDDPKLFCMNSSSEDSGVSCKIGNNPKYASSLLFVFLLNYLMSWITWARLSEVTMMKMTFIFPLLNCFPQFGEFYKPILTPYDYGGYTVAFATFISNYLHRI